MPTHQIYPFVLAVLFALAAGLVGSFAYMKRMLLASDVISHLALPGLGAAFLLNFHPLVGGAASLLLGVLLIWRLQQRTGLAIDAMIGVVFAASVGIGAAVTPKEDLLEALFGASQQLSLPGFLAGAATVGAVVFFILRLKDQLSLSVFSPELAAATGVKVSRIDLYFLLLFGVTVLVGLRFTGALLGSALIIVPAATAHQLTNRMAGFVIASCALSIFAVSAGWIFNVFVLHSATSGPTIVVVSALLFALSLLKRA
ncbi:MAG: metal ABC transporter permease [Candidatus Acidiferrales bacterium]